MRLASVRRLLLAVLLLVPIGIRAQDVTPEAATPTATTTAPVVTARKLAEQSIVSAQEALDRALRKEASQDPSQGTTAQAALLELKELARNQLDQARALSERLRELPEPTDPVAFLTSREELETLLERRRRERGLQAEKATLAVQSGLASDAALARQTARFFADQVEALEQALVELGQTWVQAYPGAEEREEAEARAFQAISDAQAQEEEAARSRAIEKTQELEASRREATELASRAREELEAATSEAESRLAELRLAYATLKKEAEELEVKALNEEIRSRDAEKKLGQTRAELAGLVPALLGPGVEARAVAEARDRLLERAARVRKEAELLASEIENDREEVPALRTETQTHADRYDQLEAGLAANRGDPVYRKQVFFARGAHRQAAARLDQYRTFVEWKERRQSAVERRCFELEAAAERLVGKAAVRYLGQTLEQWLRFLFYLIGAVIGSVVVEFLFRGFFKSMTGRTSWEWDDIAIEELRSPVRVLVLLWGIWFGLGQLRLPAAGQVVLDNWIDALGTIWMGFLCWRILNVVSRAIEPRFEASETRLDDQLLRFLRRGLRAVIIGMTGIFVLEAFGWKVTSVLAGLGIGGLAFALAAKDTLANFFGSIMLFADRPFQVGNWVVVGGVEGVVEDIGIRSTRIRTFKDTLVTMPNAMVANASAENIHSFRKRRLYFTLTLRLDTATELVDHCVQDVRAILDEHPMVLDGHYVYMTGIEDNGLVVMVYCFVATRDWREWMHHSQDVYLTVLGKLEELGVNLAFPTHTIEIEKGSPFDRLKG